MSNKDFEIFKIGTIINPFSGNLGKVNLRYQRVVIDFPSRLNAMAIDPSGISENKNSIYSPGEIVFTIPIFKRVEIKILKNGLIISRRSKRKSLIKHAFLIMKTALKFDEGMGIDVDNSNEIRHAGLGSSSSLIAAVASAINEIYGNPIPKNRLVRYLAQNHGEEIDRKPNFLNPIQCIGGSAAAGIIGGGMLVITGQSVVIKTMRISSRHKVIIGFPLDFVPRDSEAVFSLEKKNLHLFQKTGERYREQIAYNVLHQVLPAMVEKNLRLIGDVIYDYRFNMGSIANCSFVYPKLTSLANQLSFLKKENHVDVLAISSVGPTFFAITTNPKKCQKAFKELGLKIMVASIFNDHYKIVRKLKYEK